MYQIFMVFKDMKPMPVRYLFFSSNHKQQKHLLFQKYAIKGLIFVLFVYFRHFLVSFLRFMMFGLIVVLLVLNMEIFLIVFAFACYAFYGCSVGLKFVVVHKIYFELSHLFLPFGVVEI